MKTIKTETSLTRSGPMNTKRVNFDEIELGRHEFENSGNIFLSATMHGVTDVSLSKVKERKLDNGREFGVRHLIIKLENGAEFEMSLFMSEEK
jgi:hypothetical protein